MHVRRHRFLSIIGVLAAAGLGLFWMGCSHETASPAPATGIANPPIVGYTTTAPSGSAGTSLGATSVSVHLDGPVGGTVSLGAFSLYFPPKAVKGPFTVTIDIPDPSLLSCELSISPAAANKFGKPVILTFDYVGTDAAAPLTAIWYNPSTGLWEDIGGKNDPVNLSYSVELSHFSEYALSGGRAGW